MSKLAATSITYLRPRLCKHSSTRRKGENKKRSREKTKKEADEEEAKIRGHATQVTSVDWHPTRPIVLSASADHTARISTLAPVPKWHTARGRDKGEPLTHHSLLST